MRTLVTLLILLCTLGMAAAQNNTGNLPPAAFKAELDKGKAQLIDVRTPEEFAKGRIAGARNIDWINDDFMKEVAGMDKNKPVLLYCAVGGRSEEALNAMREAGFVHVQHLQGGFNAWKANGMPVLGK